MLRSKTKDVLIVYGIASLPHHPPLIPWCCLKFEDKRPPDGYHMVYQMLSVSRGQTVESLVEKYSKQNYLKALLVTAKIDQKKLDMLTTTCSFTIVIISKMYRDEIAEYLQSADESLEATIGPLYHKRRDGRTTGRGRLNIVIAIIVKTAIYIICITLIYLFDNLTNKVSFFIYQVHSETIKDLGL